MPDTPSAAPRRARFRPPATPQIDVRGFWGARADAVAARTADILYERCVQAGMLDQVDPDRPVPAMRIPFLRNRDNSVSTVSQQMFWDSDLGKVIETAAYTLYRRKNPALEARIDALVDMFAKLQQPDGYLSSWYQRMQPGLRWTNLRDCHEIYCAGHLIEGAVAYFQATGKRKLLDVMCRYADHIGTVFGPGPDQRKGYCGHEEIELALVKLARVTGEVRYMELARYFVEQRGQVPHYFDQEARARGEDPGAFDHQTYEYSQAHAPVREQDKVVGHAVRAMYLYAGLADIATEYGDETLRGALDRLWDDLHAKRLYATGGLGPSAHNEGFTSDYDLPNDTAYAETCAAVGLVFWASRMLGMGPNARYADVMELALYNGSIAGLSLDGALFFYENPLESHGGHHRWTWHRCPCCPPNVGRMVASIGSYLYGVADDAVAVHVYGDSTARLQVGGRAVTLTQDSRYPWEGAVAIEVEVEEPTRFTLHLRVPGWCRGARVAVNGAPVDVAAATRDGYVALERSWQAGDKVTLELAMGPERLYANPAVRQDLGRMALRRGPLLYCAEAVDNPGGVETLRVPRAAPLREAFEPDLLGGVVTLTGEAGRDDAAGWEGTLYRTDPPQTAPATFKAVPYFAWDNRAPGAMQVWLREEP